MKKLLSILLAVLMLTGILSMVVSAEGAKQAWVCLPGVDEKGAFVKLNTTVNEGETKYFITTDKFLATATGATADNYNIKLDYPTGGTFTIYLKGAKLEVREAAGALSVGRKNHVGYKDIADFSCIIHTETDSSLATYKYADDRHSGDAIGFVNSGAITFTGPGKLSVLSDAGMAITCANTTLDIKDAKLDVKSNSPQGWSFMPAIWARSSTVVIDNSVLDLYANNGPCLWTYDVYNDKVGDPFDLTIKNGSKITCVTNQYSTENGTIGARGTTTIDSSEVEITSTGAAAKKGVKSFARKPVLVGVNAIGGTTADKVEEYNDKKYATYFYFKCAPGLEVPTEPTEPQPTTPVDPKPTDPTPTTPTTPTTPNTPDATTPDVTTPDATTPGATTPNATTPNATKPAATNPTTGNNNTSTTPNTDKNDTDKADDKGGIPVILWVVIGVVVAGGIAAAVVVLLKKKAALAAAEDAE